MSKRFLTGWLHWTPFARRKPDLVLTDVMMPRTGRFRTAARTARRTAARDVPVILLSARAGEEARVEGIDAGADDYLIKPFSARELIARVNTNLEMARIRREATRDLRESEARFRNMADNAPVMMWVSDAMGTMTYLNRGWYDSLVRLQSGVGFGAWDALHPDDRPETERAFFAANSAERGSIASNTDCGALTASTVGC